MITFELLDQALIREYEHALYTEEMTAIRYALQSVREYLVKATNHQGPELDLYEIFKEER